MIIRAIQHSENLKKYSNVLEEIKVFTGNETAIKLIIEHMTEIN